MSPSMRPLALRISLRKSVPSSLSDRPHSSSSASVKPLRMRSGARRSCAGRRSMKVSNSLLRARRCSCSRLASRSSMRGETVARAGARRARAARARRNCCRRAGAPPRVAQMRCAAASPRSELPQLRERRSPCRAAHRAAPRPQRNSAGARGVGARRPAPCASNSSDATGCALEQRVARRWSPASGSAQKFFHEIRHWLGSRYGIGQLPRVWIDGAKSLCASAQIRAPVGLSRRSSRPICDWDRDAAAIVAPVPKVLASQADMSACGAVPGCLRHMIGQSSRNSKCRKARR